MNSPDRSSPSPDKSIPFRSDLIDTPSQSAGAQLPKGEVEPGLRTIQSSDILQGAREVIILHDGQTYRLRRTKNGKLILNK